MALSTVAVVLVEPVALFEFAVPAEIFGIDRTADGVPPFDFRVCTSDPTRPVRSGGTAPVTIGVTHGLEALEGADLVVIPATTSRNFSVELLAGLCRAHEAGATLLSVCSGVFVLAEAGLLDGRAAACHWQSAAELNAAYPQLHVQSDKLFVDHGSIITSAGTAAGIDACLHLVRRELGAEVATKIARRMVVPPQRDGGQQQFVDTPMPECTADRLAPLLDWVMAHLERDHTASSMAERAVMSPRTFARRFRAEVGTTPHQWILRQRVIKARHLLESTDLHPKCLTGTRDIGRCGVFPFGFLAPGHLVDDRRERFREARAYLLVFGDLQPGVERLVREPPASVV